MTTNTPLSMTLHHRAQRPNHGNISKGITLGSLKVPVISESLKNVDLTLSFES